jgi:FixJ family two-component response regulator
MNLAPAPVEEHSVVYLVDDDPSVLRALTRLLSAEGFETRPFTSPRCFLAEHDSNTPGCVILDLSMPEASGLDLQESIASAGGARQVIFISGKDDIVASVTAMKKGAVDFLTKPFNNETFLSAVREAIKKDYVARQHIDKVRLLQRRFSSLTHREREILSHVVSGELNKQIAFDLRITEKTVKTHRSRAMRKMGATSLAELVHFTEVLGSFEAC